MAMVEMVFVLPLLLFMMFAIAEFGIMFSRWLTLSNAVREGARVAVVYRGTACNVGAVQIAVRDAVTGYANAGGVPINNGDVTISGTPCGDADTTTTVQADYNHQLNIPFASTLGAINLDYTSTMRNE
jgi:Flp pilus assembly protein TadG